jgi:hypothetical protein
MTNKNVSIHLEVEAVISISDEPKNVGIASDAIEYETRTRMPIPTPMRPVISAFLGLSIAFRIN